MVWMPLLRAYIEETVQVTGTKEKGHGEGRGGCRHRSICLAQCGNLKLRPAFSGASFKFKLCTCWSITVRAKSVPLFYIFWPVCLSATTPTVTKDHV